MKQKIHQFNLKLFSVYLLIIAGGTLIIIHEILKTNKEFKSELISFASITSELLDTEKIKKLSGTAEDTSSVVYNELKNDLHKARKLIPDCRFTYLIGKDEETLFFYVDSEPAISADMSPAGQIFTEAPPSLYTMFDHTDIVVDGPNEDRWGSWVSCFISIKDKETKKTIAVFGADVSSTNWKRSIISKSLFSAGIILLAIFAISIAFHLGRKAYLYKKEADISLMLFKETLDNSTDAVGMSSSEGKHYYQNRAFTELFGKVGNYPPDSLYFDKKEGIEIFTSLMKGEQITREVKMYRKDGTIAHILLRAYANKDKNGNIISLVGLHNDITETKKAAEELNNALIKAKESERLKTAFLQNISHEIRTPLNAISGFAELLEKQNITEEKRQEFILIIKNNSHQLASIVSDILTISSIDTQQTQIHKEHFKLYDIMHAQYLNYSQIASQKNISFELKMLPENINAEIYTDRTKLQQILSNLLNNAFKFTLKGSVELGCSLSEDMVEFYVKDTGIGMTEIEISNIYTRFYQAENHINMKHGGTGLGLAISYSFITLLKGKIHVESIPEKGTYFVFSVPST